MPSVMFLYCAELTHITLLQLRTSLVGLQHLPKHITNLQANRSVSDQAAQSKLLAEGAEAASFIKTFVVQAKLNERGNFGKLVSAHAS